MPRATAVPRRAPRSTAPISSRLPHLHCAAPGRPPAGPTPAHPRDRGPVTRRWWRVPTARRRLPQFRSAPAEADREPAAAGVHRTHRHRRPAAAAALRGPARRWPVGLECRDRRALAPHHPRAGQRASRVLGHGPPDWVIGGKLQRPDHAHSRNRYADGRRQVRRNGCPDADRALGVHRGYDQCRPGPR